MCVCEESERIGRAESREEGGCGGVRVCGCV